MRVVCFGDSNTYGYDPRSYFGGRYGPEHRWTDSLAVKTGWDVVNAGMNGREIPGSAGELANLSLIENADLLIVMLGTNDLLQGATARRAADRMERFLQTLPIEKEKLLLIAPPPMKPGPWVTEQTTVTQSQELSLLYSTVARRLGTGFADAGKWEIPLSFDGVHFTENGHVRFASELLGVIKSFDFTAT